VRFLLDTNVLSEPLRPRPNENVLRRLGEHAADLATAAPVWHELQYGCARMPDSARRRTAQAYVRDVLQPLVTVLSYDAIAADWHAAERARLDARGRRPPFVDGQIAAIAAINGLTLVTRNVKDFRRFKGLAVADWFR
jgi:tRNA(fMet)-specific endonuclease VapC